jgi:hypothetical protein
MSNEKVFVGRCLNPRNNWEKAAILINIDDLNLIHSWASANGGKICIKINESRNGKPYAEIDTYRKQNPLETQQQPTQQHNQQPQQPMSPEDNPAYQEQLEEETENLIPF